jgi:hypothetical protein
VSDYRLLEASSLILYEIVKTYIADKTGWKNLTEKPRIYVKLLIAMQLQLKFEFILIWNKAEIHN